MALDVRVRAAVGESLILSARAASGAVAEVASEEVLGAASNQAATADDLRAQFDRLGGTVYRLEGFDAEIEGTPLVPRSVLNALRRRLVEGLDRAPVAPRRAIAEVCVLRTLRPPMPGADALDSKAALSVLCRTTGQIEAAVAAGITTIYAEYQDIKEYPKAVEAARRGEGVALYLATPRIQKPGESNIFRFLANQGGGGLLVRNAGACSTAPSTRSRSSPTSRSTPRTSCRSTTTGGAGRSGSRPPTT